MQFFPVIFGGSSNHPLTRDYAARVAAVGGSLPVSAYRAYNYLFSSLVNTMGLNPANLYAHTFDGGINGIVVPAFNRSGAIGNATNFGYVSGDYSDAGGLTQSGAKRLESLVDIQSVGLVAFGIGVCYDLTGGVSTVFGANGTSPHPLLAFEVRAGPHIPRFRLHSSDALTVYGTAPNSTSQRVAFASASANDLRVFSKGAQTGSTETGTRSAPNQSWNLWFGAINNAGNIAYSLDGTQVFSLIGIGSMTPTQMAQLDAIVREFLVRRGRPPCD
jgi:hypothetical protein